MYRPHKQIEKKNFNYFLPSLMKFQHVFLSWRLLVQISLLKGASIIISRIRYWLFIYQRLIISINTVIVLVSLNRNRNSNIYFNLSIYWEPYFTYYFLCSGLNFIDFMGSFWTLNKLQQYTIIVHHWGNQQDSSFRKALATLYPKGKSRKIEWNWNLANCQWLIPHIFS